MASLAASIFLATSDARAQVPTQVYDDVKTVIEDLIEKDVAQNVIPNIACQAPITLVYFPTTLQRVFDRQFGALQTAIQNDGADLAGSLVYDVLVSPPADPKALLSEFITSEVQANHLEGLSSDSQCGNNIRTDGGPLYYGANARSLLSRGCSVDSTGVDRVDSVACDLGRAAKDLVLGDSTGAEGEIRLAIAAILASPSVASSDIAPLAALLQRYIAEFTTDPGVDLKKIIAADPKLPASVVNAADFKDRVRRIAQEWQLATGGGKAWMTLSAFARYSLVATDALALCPAVSECTNFRNLVKAGVPDLRRILEATSSHDVTAVAVDVLREIFTVRNRMTCDSHPATLVTVSEAAPKYDLMRQLNVPQSTNKQPPPAAAATAPPQAPAAPAAAAPPANVPKTAKEQPSKPQAPVQCDRQILIDRYGQFLAALAAYTIETASKGTASSETRSAFESAAFDVLQTDGPRTGMNRDWGWNLLWPKPSLRVSWSGGYVNGAGSDGFRTLATVDWLTMRIPLRYRQSAYLVLDASLVDLLGPFAEAALRKQTTYEDSALEWSEFLAPRLELLFGVPNLTTHLALVGGISYRAAAVGRNRAGALKYFSPFGSMDDWADGSVAYYSQFIESSLGVRYLP